MSTHETFDQPRIRLVSGAFENCPFCQNEACDCPSESEEKFCLVDYSFKTNKYESGVCIHIETEVEENDHVQDSVQMIQSVISILLEMV